MGDPEDATITDNGLKLINDSSCRIMLITKSTDLISKKTTPVMKTYLIERDIPNAGNFTAAELKLKKILQCFKRNGARYPMASKLGYW